jgi:hypothetical protein
VELCDLVVCAEALPLSGLRFSSRWLATHGAVACAEAVRFKWSVEELCDLVVCAEALLCVRALSSGGPRGNTVLRGSCAIHHSVVCAEALSYAGAVPFGVYAGALLFMI